MDASPQEGAPGSPTAARLFTLLWRTLSNLVGTPATATLLRRSLKRVEPQYPQLSRVRITRAEHDYVFTLPPEWSESSDLALEELRTLYRELCTLSQQLTGSVILRRLESLSEFAILRPPSHEDKKP